MTKKDPFRYFKTSREVIRLAVMMYIRFPLSLSNVADLLHERGIDVSHETVRYWWNRFGPSGTVICGRLRFCKGFLERRGLKQVAVMCPAFLRGAIDSGP